MGREPKLGERTRNRRHARPEEAAPQEGRKQHQPKTPPPAKATESTREILKRAGFEKVTTNRLLNQLREATIREIGQKEFAARLTALVTALGSNELAQEAIQYRPQVMKYQTAADIAGLVELLGEYGISVIKKCGYTMRSHRHFVDVARHPLKLTRARLCHMRVKGDQTTSVPSLGLNDREFMISHGFSSRKLLHSYRS